MEDNKKKIGFDNLFFNEAGKHGERLENTVDNLPRPSRPLGQIIVILLEAAFALLILSAGLTQYHFDKEARLAMNILAIIMGLDIIVFISYLSSMYEREDNIKKVMSWIVVIFTILFLAGIIFYLWTVLMDNSYLLRVL